MKKILTFILLTCMVLSFAACGEKPAEDVEINPDEIVENAEENEKVDAPQEDKAPAKEETAQKPEEKPAATPEDAAARVAELMEAGMSRKDAVKQTAKELDLPKNVVYDIALKENE